jgi:hypothetical protein
VTNGQMTNREALQGLHVPITGLRRWSVEG